MYFEDFFEDESRERARPRAATEQVIHARVLTAALLAYARVWVRKRLTA